MFELIVVGGADVTERKLLDDADVLVALPGGVGTHHAGRAYAASGPVPHSTRPPARTKTPR